MTASPEDCCQEYAAVSRRGFLRGAVAAAGAASVTATFGSVVTETAYAAASPGPRSVLVVLSMRGAADGLSLVVPHADPAYYAGRPRIAVPKEALLAADAQFGLNPNLAALLPLWQQGRMAAVHATGLPVLNRSHFSAMEAIEDAAPGSSSRSGWLNRLVGTTSWQSPVEAVQYGSTIPAAQIRGPEPVVVTAAPGAVALRGGRGVPVVRRRQELETLWANAPGPAGRAVRTAFTAVDAFAPVRAAAARPQNGAAYPQGNLSDALQNTARTIRADVGATVVTVDHGSWDHHVGLGTVAGGAMKTMATELAGAVAAFFTDLGPLAGRVTLVTVSEFGRRVVENANLGLDHGHGTVMFVMGAGVRGGRYYAAWPGLEATPDGDLAVTTDYRSVLAEVVTSRFGVSTASVFPGFTPDPLGLMVAS
jgi:uncharacterized protein (DUF1501 family)